MVRSVFSSRLHPTKHVAEALRAINEGKREAAVLRSSSHDKDTAGGMGDKSAGYASQQEFLEPAQSPSAYHD